MALFTNRRFAQYMRLLAIVTAVSLFAATLSGCMYPDDQRKQNQAAPKEAIRNVQGAIDQYKDETGMLPIKNSDAQTPVYEKFLIDFAKLQRTGYLSDLPSAAFEKGGNFYFLVIDEETNPRVKLMDLVTYQKVNDIQGWVKAYVQNGGELPKGEQMYPGFYQIDYKLMNKTAPVIQSVFSGQSINALVDEGGVVYADYGIDIMQLIQKNGDMSIDEKLDLRTLLVDDSDYVPVKSPIYHYVNGEPQAAKP
ncbi:hypothetical protein [Paenibacillus sp. 2TAB19]|uniref:hypothetical protein n=1 Tax=Paenibacillus sp. 2TAB19 TaxID=3233003 RepID=UPI003F9CF60A